MGGVFETEPISRCSGHAHGPRRLPAASRRAIRAGAETPAPSEQVAATNACGIIAHRNWTATRSAGGSPALTVAGELDLPTPGYSVSLARDADEAAGATEARLTLTLTPPTNMVAQVVTATPVRYFGPAATAYTSVNVNCGGETLTTISVTVG